MNNIREVILCKDCKHYDKVCGEWSCFHPKQKSGWNSEGGECLQMELNDFCSYGELRNAT